MRRRERGFSLIELLIVVAIIAALVGVAVPFFQDNLKDAQQTKAKEDLDTIRNAISLYDAQNRPLTGTSLRPLLGRYLQDIPRDPWGNDYMLDANVGIVLSYGADAVSGGKGTDEDIYMRYKAPLRIQRAQYKGNWGPPVANTEILLTMTKPYLSQVAWEPDFLQDFALLRSARDSAVASGWPCNFQAGTTLHSLDAVTAYHPSGAANSDNQTWGAVSISGNVQEDQKNGYIVLRQTFVITKATQTFTATMAVNFDTDSATWDTANTQYTISGGYTIPVSFGLCERFFSKGPLDPEIYGLESCRYFISPQPIDLIDGEDRGVKLERY